MSYGASTQSESQSGTRLYLLRHAQTADVSKFHGAESDIGLSPWGHEQSRRLARRFLGSPITTVYCSAMKRARDTAQPIAELLKRPMQQVPTLHERKMGHLAGVSREDFRHVYVDAMQAWSEGNLNFSHESGESFWMMQQRSIPAITELLNRHRGESIIVVSHGMLIRVLLASLVRGMSPADIHEIKIDNCAVNELQWDGKMLEALKLYQLSEDLQNPPEDKPFW